MRKIIYPALVLGCLLMNACSNDPEPTANGEAKLVVDLGADLSFTGENTGAKKRAIDESAYTNIRNYTVTLTKTATGETVHSDVYSNWALAYQVESGTQYTLTASYGEEAAASYDKLLVTGSETFNVQPGSTKQVSFQCKPKAAKINVVFSDDFSEYYSDCEVSIKTKHMTSAVVMSKGTVGQDLYIKADDNGEPVSLDFNILDLNGSPVVIDGVSTSKSVTIKPQTLLKITIKPNVTEIAGGKFGLNITVNTGVTEEDVNIVIPNSVFE